jgi:extradiol dioxygenase family protein
MNFWTFSSNIWHNFERLSKELQANTMQNFFHLAFPVRDLAEAREFYVDILECAEGRSASHWIDFDLYGHQIVAHLAPIETFRLHSNQVDGDAVPVPHFGVILPMSEWRALADKLQTKGVEFIIEPHIRFKGETGEQATMFFLDPSGNALEFKAFADFSQIFAK